MLAAMIDWTQVLILGVPAYIAALGGAVAAIIAAKNRRDIRTPSGTPLGHVVDRRLHASERAEGTPGRRQGEPNGG